MHHIATEFMFEPRRRQQDMGFVGRNGHDRLQNLVQCSFNFI